MYYLTDLQAMHDSEPLTSQQSGPEDAVPR
jgi:hypothetical protein